MIGHLQEFADGIKSGLREADWLTRQEIIRALVKRLEVDEAQVRVIYRVDPLPFDEGPARGHLQDCWRREIGPIGENQVSCQLCQEYNWRDHVVVAWVDGWAADQLGGEPRRRFRWLREP